MKWMLSILSLLFQWVDLWNYNFSKYMWPLWKSIPVSFRNWMVEFFKYYRVVYGSRLTWLQRVVEHRVFNSFFWIISQMIEHDCANWSINFIISLIVWYDQQSPSWSIHNWGCSSQLTGNDSIAKLLFGTKIQKQFAILKMQFFQSICTKSFHLRYLVKKSNQYSVYYIASKSCRSRPVHPYVLRYRIYWN